MTTDTDTLHAPLCRPFWTRRIDFEAKKRRGQLVSVTRSTRVDASFRGATVRFTRHPQN